MKKFILIMFALSMLVMGFALTTVTIGTGTSTGRHPLNDYFTYSRSQCIYLASEIGQPSGTITKLRWYRNDTGANANAIGTTEIWLTETSATTLSGSAWVSPGTLVKTVSNIDLGSGGGWCEVDIDDYIYGGSNLLVSVRTQNAPYTSPHSYWRYTTTSSNYRMLAGNSDTVNPPALSTSYLRPNIQMDIEPAATNPEPTNYPVGFATLSAAVDGITLTWTGSIGAQLPYRYLIVAKTGAGSFAIPTDGTPVADDNDWSDDNGAVNIAHIDGTNTYTYTGLTQNTSYDFKIYPYTNAAESIDFKTDGTPPAASGTTLDATINPDWAESFDAVTFPPNGYWLNVKTAGSGTPGIWSRETTGTAPTCTPHSGAAMIRYNSSSLSNGTKGELSTPPITFSGDDYRVSFWMYRGTGYSSYNQEVVNVYYSAIGQTSVGATLLGTVPRYIGFAPVETTEGWYNYKFNMPVGATGSGRHVIIEGVSQYGANIFLDDLSIEQLPNDPIFSYSPITLTFPATQSGLASAAQNVRVTNIGGGSLQLRAEDIRLSGEDIDDFRFSDANLADPLSAGQGLDIPVTFEPQRAGAKTATLVITYDSIDYEVALSGYAYAETALFEGFEGAFPPAGWANPGSWSSSTTAYAGAKSVYKYGSGYILSTPKLELEADSKLVFMARISNITSALDIVYSTDRTSWTKLGESILAPTANTWFQNVIDLSGIPDRAGRYYLGFRTMGSASYYVDNVIMPAAAREAPEAVTLSSPANAAVNQVLLPTLSWTPASTGGIPTSYDIYLEATDSPVDPEADPRELLVNVPASPYTLITPLNYSTTYIWKVVAKNANGDAPDSAVRSFTTMDNPVISTFPTLYDFGTATSDAFPPLNWTRYSGVLADPTVMGAEGTGYWRQDDWLNNTSIANKAARLEIYSTWNGWLISPPISVPANDYEVMFDVAYMYYSSNNAPNTTGTDDKFAVLVGDGTSWSTANVVRQWDNAGSEYVLNSIPPAGMTVSLPLGTAGMKYVAFYAGSTISNADNDLMVDNITFRQTPSAPVYTITPDLTETWDFGLNPIGGTAEKTFVISNMGAGSLEISSIGTSDTYYSVEEITPIDHSLANGESTSFKVKYTPLLAGGPHTGTVTISYTGTSGSPDTIDFTGSAYAPATLPLTEDWESGQGDWIFVNGTQTNKWYVGTADPQEGAASAYISNDNGVSNAYTISSAISTTHIYRDIAFGAENESFPLTFQWRNAGESSWDRMRVYLVDTSVTPVAGTELTAGQVGLTNYSVQSNWTTGTITLPGSLSGTVKRLVFSWRNDGSGGTQPPINLDNISLTAVPLPTEPIFAINPTVKAFGTVSIGASDTQTFTISNQGAGTMNIQSVVLTGDLAQFSLIDLNTYPMAVGEPITVSVAFTPVAEGDFSVTLTIVDDIAKSKGNRTVTITGSGFDATIREIPYIQTWDVLDLVVVWKIQNVNNDAYTWEFVSDGGSNVAKIRYNGSMAMNDWLISPPIVLEGGIDYTVSYDYRSSGSYFPESMKVAFGTAQAPGAMTEVIADHNSIASSTYLSNSATFTPSADGSYFLGFHGYSEADMNSLFLDNIRILLPNTQIAQVTATGATATVTVPAITVGGAEISPVVAFAGLSGNPVIEVSASCGPTTDPLTNERLVLNIDGGNLAGVTVNFTHNLGFIPQVLAYQLGAGATVIVPNPNDWTATTASFQIPSGKGPNTLKVIFPKTLEDTLPITLSSFTAVLTADLHVNIAWIAETETNHAGYNILRSEVKELSTAMMINSALIDAGTTSGTQISYQYTDTEVYHNAHYYYWLEDRSLTGESTYHGPLMVTISAQGEEIEIPVIPVETKLFSAFPNPFNPSTNLRYSMKEAGDVRIDVYNLKGQLLKSFNNSHNQAGYYQVSWDGHDANGRLVGTGVYFYRMSSGNYSSTKKMIMAK